MKKTLLLALAGLGLLTLPVMAQSQDDQPMQFRQGARPKMDKARFDSNGDGQLDDSERAAMRRARMEKHKDRWAPFDSNGNGELDDDEREAMRKTMMAKHKDRWAPYDSNGDGDLDQSERQAMRQAIKAKFDTNGDGQLDDSERDAMRQQMKGRRGQMRTRRGQ